MESKKETIMVCIPSGSHMVNARILTFATQVGKKDPTRNYRLSIVDGAKGYDFPRNQLAKMFLESDADRLWFIDEDTCPPDNVMELVDVDADIVTGMVPVFKGGNPGSMYFNVYKETEKPGVYKPINPRVGPFLEDVHAGGCAAMIIRRAVLEDPRMRLKNTWVGMDGEVNTLDESEAPPIFQTQVKPNGEIWLGEDMHFCYRARRLGYSVKAYAGTQWGHLKMVNLFDMMKLQQAMYAKGYEAAAMQTREAVGA